MFIMVTSTIVDKSSKQCQNLLGVPHFSDYKMIPFHRRKC